MSGNDLPALLALASDIAHEAGELLVGLRAIARTDIRTKSSPTEMVSDADRASEHLIRDRVLAARPQDAVLGEEGGERSGAESASVRWIVDPLDGTTNFLYGQPVFVVSIGIEVEGQRSIGVVFDPSHREMFTAIAGGGARRNGAPIEVSGKADLGTALVGTGFSYDPQVRAVQGVVVGRVLPRVRDIRRHGAAARDLCWVACGRLDAYFERGLQPWDMAAGELIVREAGGLTAAIEGGPAVAGSMIAASPALLGPLGALVREAERPASR